MDNNNNNFPQQDPMNNQPENAPQQPEQPIYQQPPMNAQPPMGPVQDPNKGKAIASLVLGIISVGLSWFISVGAIVTLVIGIVGIVLANKYKKESNEFSAYGTYAKAGMILSIIGIVCSGIVLACAICVICAAAGFAATGSLAGIEGLSSGLY